MGRKKMWPCSFFLLPVANINNEKADSALSSVVVSLATTTPGFFFQYTLRAPISFFIFPSGPLCDEKIDFCASFPCQNDGVCQNSALARIGYRCLCLPGYIGDNCQVNINPLGALALTEKKTRINIEMKKKIPPKNYLSTHSFFPVRQKLMSANLIRVKTVETVSMRSDPSDAIVRKDFKVGYLFELSFRIFRCK